MVDDINLRAAAKQSFDSVFAIAYPQLRDMITSIDQEMTNTLQDSRRELRKMNLNLEAFNDKLLTVKSQLNYVTSTYDAMNSYLEKMVGVVGVASGSGGGGGGGGGGVLPFIPEVNRKPPKAKNPQEQGPKEEPHGAAKPTEKPVAEPKSKIFENAEAAKAEGGGRYYDKNGKLQEMSKTPDGKWQSKFVSDGTKVSPPEPTVPEPAPAPEAKPQAESVKKPSASSIEAAGEAAESGIWASIKRGGKWALGKAAVPALAAYACWEAYQQIKEIDAKDPDKSKKITKIVADLVARFGVVWVATILGTIAAGAVSGPGAIAGFIGGLGAGLAADYFLGDSVDKIVESLIDKIWPAVQSAGEAIGITPSNDNVKQGDLSSLGDSDNLKFIADKIIFKSAKGGGAMPQSSIGGGGIEPPTVQRVPGGISQTGMSIPGINAPGAVPTGGRGGGGIVTSGMFGSYQPQGTGSMPSSPSMRFDATKAGGGAGGTASQSEYYNRMYNAVYKAAKDRGLPHPEVIASLGASQTSLETGYGKSMVGNNAFGIKGTGSAGSVNANTQEFVGGRMVGMKQNFRAYGDVTESAADYVDMMLKNQKRYGAVLTAATVEEAIAAQGRTGYATDPNYAAKLASINSKFGGQAVPNPVAATNKPVAAPQNTGAVINKESTEAKVSKENAQRSSSVMINNVVADNSKPAAPEQQQAQKKTEVAMNERLAYNLVSW